MPSAEATVVVGGGLSGLAVALGLHRAARPVRVLEAADSPGGMARTLEREGFLLETGPNSVLDREGEVAQLANSLGLALQPAAASAARRSIVLGGRLVDVPTSPGALLGTGVLPLLAKLRLLLEPLSGRAPAGVDESLGEFSRRHLGRTVTSTLVDALQTGIWAGDMERLSAASAFPRLVALEHTYRSLLLGALRSRGPRGSPRPPRLASLEGGLGALSYAMARELGAQLRLNTRVTALDRTADGWRLTTAEGAVSASQVVLALPPDVAAALVRPFDEGLSGTLASFPTVPVAVVHLGYRPALTPEPEGFGFLVPTLEGRDILGTVYASCAFPFRAQRGGTLLTVLLGGAHRPELLQQDDEGLVQRARAELSALLGVNRAPTLAEVCRWPRAIPQYNIGHAERVRTALSQAARWPGLWLSGNAYSGAGVPDCLRAGGALAQRLLAA